MSDDRPGEWPPFLNALFLGGLLFAGVASLVPGVGPNLRLFTTGSASMAPTLDQQSVLVVSRWSYGLSRWSYDWVRLPIEGRLPDLAPVRGDVVVFRDPRDDAQISVARVVGLPGERVQMRAGRLVIDGGEAHREPAPTMLPGRSGVMSAPVYIETLPGGRRHRILEAEGDAGPLDDTPEIAVPAGHVFVMGDNRDNAMDSRVAAAARGYGPVPIARIVGRVLFDETFTPP